MPKLKRSCTRLYVEERLLLDRVGLDARNVPPRDL